MIFRFCCRLLLLPGTLMLLVSFAHAQTVEIDGQRVELGPKAPKPSAPRSASRSSGVKPTANTPFGWGSNIGIARETRAAGQALKSGNFSEALFFAQQAANSSSRDPNAWFLLGYAARLAGRTQVSIDAYNHGLQLQPGSIDGLSGLAQTYVKAGNSEEAKRLIVRILAVDPKRENELLMAGELFLQSGDSEQALSFLRRAESMHRASRTEILTATALMRLKKPDGARAMLERAKSHAAGSPEVARAFAAYYREARNYPAAIQTLAAIPHKSADLLAELAWTYQLGGDNLKSAQTYSLAADADPKNVHYQLETASAWLAIDKADTASRYLDRVGRLEPNHYRLHAIRAELARTQGRAAEAAHEYELALANIPESVPEGPLYPLELRMSLANLYENEKNDAFRKQQMDLAWNSILKLDIQGTDRPEFLRLRAAIQAGRGDAAGAEHDYKAALALAPNNSQIMLGYAALLWRIDRKSDARQMFASVLKVDSKNRYAMMSLGYLARDFRENREAERYFNRVASLYPKDYEPYLALGDLYVAERKSDAAQNNYENAYKLAPRMALIVAGGANNGIECHKLDLAGAWLTRAVGAMNDEPHVMRERERYLTWTGKYEESAAIGRKVIQFMPADRDAAVYLGYDLYNLGRYDELLQLTSKYEVVLPKEANFPLLSGYVKKHRELLPQAIDDFTRAMERDPQMVEAYVNRGYVLNDMQNAEEAAEDFNHALKLSPNDGVAHLGIAFSYLELRRPKLALEHAEKARKLMGDSAPTHLAMAGAYRQQQLFGRAADEYRAALKLAPTDQTLHLALADVLFHEHRYNDSADEYKEALAASPEDPFLYAQLANTYAHLRDRQLTYQYVSAAEQEGAEDSSVLQATGGVLLSLGDRDAALDRFRRALELPDADRFSIRLGLAELFVIDGHFEEARQQLGVGLVEARIGDAQPITAEQFAQAASLLLSMHDFDTSRRLYTAAENAGADARVVAVGVANTYLAEGFTQKAKSQLLALGDPADLQENYDYQLAMANVFRQEGNSTMALSAMSRASALVADDETVRRDELDVAAQAGLPVKGGFNVISDSSFSPIFEDATIYQLDARMFGVSNPSQLPRPRYSYESRSTAYFRAQPEAFPLITGFVEERNARGEVSFPSANTILNRDTYDTTVNSTLNPVLRIGSTKLHLSAGLQFTVRRDKASPTELNQNLFRQFVYLTTSPISNWLEVSGDLIHEAGPFILQPDSSKDDAAHLRFRVGRPWGKTALITGYGIRDLQLHPTIREYFSTNAYGGIEHTFNRNWKATGLGELIRSWRVQDTTYAIAQAVRPSLEVEYRRNSRWSFDGSFAMTRGFGMHNYDNVEGGFLLSYTRPWRGRDAVLPDATVDYPLRFSIGMRTQSFYDFGAGSHNTIVPVFRISLF